MSRCYICPRRCGADRVEDRGLCGCGKLAVSHYQLHLWEEPPISGINGSGAIFFPGCPLGCVFCQNAKISRNGDGKYIGEAELEKIIFELEEAGAHNINLVSAVPYTLEISKLLEKIKPKLKIPVVYNSSGYELVDSLKMLDGLVDVYLPDIKFYSRTLSQKYANASNYYQIAVKAVKEMFRQTGKYIIKDGLIKKGIIIRHLVLPGCSADSLSIIDGIAEVFSPDEILLSVMSQFTPTNDIYPELCRKLTTLEYNRVCKKVLEHQFEGYFQERVSASKNYIPEF